MTAGRERAAAWALIAAQIVHGIVPAPTSEHSAVGPIAGVLLLALSLAAVIGLVRGKHSAHALLGWTGFSVAVGFVLYHALPWHTPFTRPYVGEAVGVAGVGQRRDRGRRGTLRRVRRPAQPFDAVAVRGSSADVMVRRDGEARAVV